MSFTGSIQVRTWEKAPQILSLKSKIAVKTHKKIKLSLRVKIHRLPASGTGKWDFMKKPTCRSQVRRLHYD